MKIQISILCFLLSALFSVGAYGRDHTNAPPGLQFLQINDAFEIWAMGGNGTLPNVDGDSTKSLKKLRETKDVKLPDLTEGGLAYVPGLHIMFNETQRPLVLIYFKHSVSRPADGPLNSGTAARLWYTLFLDHGLHEAWLDTDAFRTFLQKTLEFVDKTRPPHWQRILEEHEIFMDSIKDMK